jgi:hypothetical protein
LITAHQILTSLKESMVQPENNVELVNIIAGTIGSVQFNTASLHSWPAKQLVFKRYIPEATYSGEAYRFTAIRHEEAVKVGIFPDWDSAISFRGFDKRNLLDFVVNFKRESSWDAVKGSLYTVGGNVSWAKSIGGIIRELTMGSRLHNLVTQKDPSYVYIFSARLDGAIDIEKAALYAAKIYYQASDEEKKKMYDIESRLYDARGSQEVLAPMTRNIKLEGVYDPRDLTENLWKIGVKNVGVRDLTDAELTFLAKMLVGNYGYEGNLDFRDMAGKDVELARKIMAEAGYNIYDYPEVQKKMCYYGYVGRAKSRYGDDVEDRWLKYDSWSKENKGLNELDLQRIPIQDKVDFLIHALEELGKQGKRRR